MIEIFMLYLSIPSRINFLQLGRYSLSGEQRFRRQFEQGFDFFGFNKALATVNIAKIMQLGNPDTRENSFSMATYKVLFHNSLMLSRFFRLFAINPNSIKNHQHVKELLNFGTMAA
ncbi:MAG: hypothetical protein AB7U05_04830 [Mangrovibacterium sp.]